jgi:hypothetical protein
MIEAFIDRNLDTIINGLFALCALGGGAVGLLVFVQYVRQPLTRRLRRRRQ